MDLHVLICAMDLKSQDPVSAISLPERLIKLNFSSPQRKKSATAETEAVFDDVKLNEVSRRRKDVMKLSLRAGRSAYKDGTQKQIET